MLRSRIGARLAILAVLSSPIAIPSGCAGAQSIQVNAGTSPAVRVLPGGRLAVPIIVDLSSAGPINLAALTVGLNWGPGALSLDSLRAAPGLGWAFTPSTGGAGGGNISFTTSNSSPLAGTSTVANAFFSASPAASGTRITPTISAASNAAQQNILAAMRPRSLDVCVAIWGRWGDATSDNAVNIVDAQQIARFSIGLPVFDANSASKRGDVTNDAAVNIIDAQQIARFSVSLPAAARTGADAYVQSIPAAATMAPSSVQRMGVAATVQMTATPSNPTAGNLTGCESFLWTTSDPAVASVNGTGFVTGISAGAATITATAVSNPSVSVTGSIIVEDPTTIRVTLTHAGRPAKQYIAEVTGGGFGAAQGFVLSGVNMNGGVLDIPVPSTGAYTVHVVAIDAASTVNPMVIAGGVLTVNVAASGIINRQLTLDSPTYTMLTVPSTVRLGATVAVSWRVTDPALLLDGQERGVIFCGTVHTNINVMTTDFSGAESDACGVTISGQGVLTYSNSTTPIGAQVVPGSLRMQMRATQLVRTGTGPATDILVHWLNPSVMRGETPLSITVPPLVDVQVFPASPSIAAGTTRQMSTVAQDAIGVISGLPIAWSATSPSIASVSPAGLVTGVSSGQGPIVATIATKTGSTVVTVSATVPVASVTVDPLPSLSGNGTTTAVATARDANGNIISNVALAWTTSNFRVARISGTGDVQALGSGTAQITATAGAVSGSAMVTVTPMGTAFGIVLRPRTSMSPSVTAAFTSAAQRWSQVIRGDIPNAALVNSDISVCLDQVPGTTVLNETVDDVVIYSNVVSIDGAGGILAKAGPCVLRGATGQTVIGVMTFDVDDIAPLETDGSLTSVILHEMGHVLGIGTNWGPLLQNPAPSPGTGDPVFVGTVAQWMFPQLGTGYVGAIVPVENCCGTGTRNVHWRESVLLRELMTGFLTTGGGINPLSPLTAASLIDIGYVVDVSQSDLPPSFLRALPGTPTKRTPINEVVIGPRFILDGAGRTGQIRNVGAPVSAPPVRRD